MKLIDAINEIRGKYPDAQTSKGKQITSPEIDAAIKGKEDWDVKLRENFYSLHIEYKGNVIIALDSDILKSEVKNRKIIEKWGSVRIGNLPHLALTALKDLGYYGISKKDRKIIEDHRVYFSSDKRKVIEIEKSENLIILKIKGSSATYEDEQEFEITLSNISREKIISSEIQAEIDHLENEMYHSEGGNGGDFDPEVYFPAQNKLREIYKLLQT